MLTLVIAVEHVFRVRQSDARRAHAFFTHLRRQDVIPEAHSSHEHASSGRDSVTGELRQRQQVAVRIPKPGDPIATRRRPHGCSILVHTVKANAADACSGQIRNHGVNVGDLPAKHGERLHLQLIHLGHPQHRRPNADNARERRDLLDGETESVGKELP